MSSESGTPADERRNGWLHQWYRHVPGKAAAVVVFLVALTTLLGNVLELNDKRRSLDAGPAPHIPKPVPAVASPAAAPPAVQPQRYRLQVERIVVDNDGSPGTTDWRFTVLVDGEPLFAFRQDDLDDAPGRNVSLPADAQGHVRLKPGQRLLVSVHGWRLSRLHAADRTPDAVGQGELSADSPAVPIRVVADDLAHGALSMHVGIDPVQPAQ